MRRPAHRVSPSSLLARSGSSLAALAVLSSIAIGQQTWYVDDDAPAGGQGSDWSSAFATVQDALAVAQVGDTIAIAAGSYRPDLGGGRTLNDRDATFSVGSHSLVGGYRGLGAGGAPDDRDHAQFPTLLTGTLDAGAAARHVVTIAASGARLDGVEIAGGNAAGFGGGGAIRCAGHDLELVDVTVSSCIADDGGGIWIAGGSLVMTRGAIRHCDTTKSGRGGALFAEDATLQLTGAALSNANAFDTARDGKLGGGLHARNSASRLVEVAISGCNASRGAALDVDGGSLEMIGGTIHGNGGYGWSSGYAWASESIRLVTTMAQLDRCTFSSDDSNDGCIFDATSLLTLSRCTIVDSAIGGAIAAAPTLTDCSFEGYASLSIGSGEVVRCRFVDPWYALWLTTAPGGITTIDDCLFAACPTPPITLRSGSGASNAAIVIRRCTIVDNGDSDGVGCGGIDALGLTSGTLTVSDSILRGNVRDYDTLDETAQLRIGAGATLSIDRCDVEGWSGRFGGSGNFDADALFVARGSGDWRLAAASPCIDVGDPAFRGDGARFTDPLGNCRVLDGTFDRTATVDLGCHEFAHVRIDWDAAAPAGTVRLVTEGTAGLPVVLFVGVDPLEAAIPRLGTLFVDLATAWIVTDWGTIPSVVDETLPSGLPSGLVLQVQALAASGGAGNLSNRLQLELP